MSFLILKIFTLLASAIEIAPHPSEEELKNDLKIQIQERPAAEKTCRLYLVHTGSTERSKARRLQGWQDLPLTASGREEIERLSERFDGLGISAIYSSSLQSATESGEILRERMNCKQVIALDELRGEYHGSFEGYTKEQYSNEPHFKFYDSLPPEEELFFPS